MNRRARMKKWIQDHPEWAQIAAQAAVVTTAVLLGVGLSRTFKADAQEQVDRLKLQNEDLRNENVSLLIQVDDFIGGHPDYTLNLSSQELDGMTFGDVKEFETTVGNFEVKMVP